jgi:hypothetical protein
MIQSVNDAKNILLLQICFKWEQGNLSKIVFRITGSQCNYHVIVLCDSKINQS